MLRSTSEHRPANSDQAFPSKFARGQLVSTYLGTSRVLEYPSLKISFGRKEDGLFHCALAGRYEGLVGLAD